MTSMSVKIEKLPDGSHKRAGRFDKASRWYPDECFVVPGSFRVRSPSRAWPYGYLKHFYSIKYSRLLFNDRPDLWLDLNGMDKKSQAAAPYLALAAARKMGAEKRS